MTDLHYTILTSRTVLKISGDDARSFLQGLVSNDLDRVSATHAIYAAFLTPQGKFLHDMFIASVGGELFLDCEAARADDLKKRLSLYRLRAKVEIAPAPEMNVAALFGPDILNHLQLSDEPGQARTLDAGEGDGTIYVDPRLAAAGARAIVRKADQLAELGLSTGTEDEYDRHRLNLGLPDGSRDIVVDKALLLESGFEELNGVDFDKGCYMGQELTARTKYRGLVKKRLMPVAIAGDAPPPGTEILAGGKNAGELRSSAGGHGIALIRLEALEAGHPMIAGDAEITPARPDWAAF